MKHIIAAICAALLVTGCLFSKKEETAPEATPEATEAAPADGAAAPAPAPEAAEPAPAE